MSSKKPNPQDPEGSEKLSDSAVLATTQAVVRVQQIAERHMPAHAVDGLMDAIMDLVRLANENGRKVGYSAGYDAAHQDHVDGRIG